MLKHEFVLSSGEKVPIVIESHRGLRNITLRPKIQPKWEIHISKPWLTSTYSALKFLEQKRAWCEKVFLSAPPRKRLHPGDTLEFLGRKVLIRHDPNRRVNEFIFDEGTKNPVLIIGGGEDMFESRIRNFIKAQFLTEVKKIIKNTPRKFWPARIAVRDTSTRWGSCSTSGTMSLSWRLALAPPEIMRYVILHELAHKEYMDHSPKFWAQVAKLYGSDVSKAKNWLSENGVNLHRYL